jgi:hypothetical protein
MLNLCVASDHLRCTCCGAPAYAIDEDHGALCPECLESLADIQDFLNSLEIP